MSGFAKVPNDLAFDSKLSFGARATYPALMHMAWKAGRRKVDDGVELPPLDAVAEAVGCSRTALKGYLRELKESGWVHTARTARQRPQTYWILDAPDPDFAGRIPTHESGGRRADSDPLSRGRGSSPFSKTELEPKNGSSSITKRPPKLVKVNNRNLAFDVLAEVTGFDDPNGAPKVAVALNGRGELVGIRQLAWDELTPQAQEAYRAAPPAWEMHLAKQIASRAEAYRAAMPRGTMLTPTALASWWARVERLADDHGLLTPEEMDRLVEEATR